MKYCKLALMFLCITLSFNSFSQDKEAKRFKIRTIAFYNLENLFDTINDPIKYDEASPIMEMNTGREDAYKRKVRNMAKVIADIGIDEAHDTPAVLGVCEIENREVLVDVVNDPLLVQKDYGIVYFDGPDRRSIDVALLYQKSLFTPISTSNHELKIYDDDTRERVYTRDQLLVTGKLDGEVLHFIVNHWPSRSGGEARSRSKRVAAAKLNKRLIDSLQSINPYAKVITMGDLNDDPTNESVKEVLKAEANIEDLNIKGLYNPYENFYKKGLGTTAYRDAWSLFDQIIMTKPFTEKDYSSYQLYKANIYNKYYLTTKRGRWKGYPFRSWGDGGFTDGFSDHFPVYIYLIKQVKE